MAKNLFDNLSENSVKVLLNGITRENARDTLSGFNGSKYLGLVLARVFAVAKEARDRELFDLAISAICEMAEKSGRALPPRAQMENMW